ncbi:MAG: hypothetical protein WD557_06880 [Dehalococcoidia bacterium]
MRQRAIIAAALCGLVAIVAIPLVIFQFGRHDPSPPSLQDEPIASIPGEVLFFDEDGCVVEVAASGAEPRILTCDIATSPASFLTRIDAQSIALAQSRFGPGGGGFDVTVLNLETGEETTGRVSITDQGFPFGMPNQESVHGERVSVGQDGEVTVLAGTEKRVIQDFDVAEYRGPQFLTWSPDGEWMLLSYYGEDEQELWVLSRDGETAGTLAKGLRQPVVSWYIEGLGAWPVVEIVAP